MKKKIKSSLKFKILLGLVTILVLFMLVTFIVQMYSSNIVNKLRVESGNLNKLNNIVLQFDNEFTKISPADKLSLRAVSGDSIIDTFSII